MTQTVTLDGENLTLHAARAIALGAKVRLPRHCKPRVDAAYETIQKLARGKAPVYGVNTGYGYLANKRIPDKQLKQLQLNIIKSHASGYGPPLTIPQTRLAMALRLNVLAKGYSGVRWKLCQTFEKHINAGIYPIIPQYGSVGASGDLAPLAHLALPIIGLGMVNYKNTVMPAREALKKVNLQAIRLVEKEGLSLVNGTQVMLAVGGLALIEAVDLAIAADKITALTYEGLQAHTSPLHSEVHALRGHPMQEASAHTVRSELEESYLWHSNLKRERVQDPYSLRCAPQVHGAVRSMLAYAASVVERELNAATDNPLVLTDTNGDNTNGDAILSGGNFHGEPLALAFDAAAMATSELASISERRLELMLNPNYSGLPPFLTENSGINSGYMAMQYLAASLVNANKILANPASTDSIPGNVGIEDHVSMGATSARKFTELVGHVRTILAIELLAAAQAVDLRKVKKMGIGTKKTHGQLRKKVKHLSNDRIIADDVEKAVEVVKNMTNIAEGPSKHY